jgi:hypothetical protein
MVLLIVAHRLLSFGRNVLDGGGDEVGGFEDLEVALGVVVALGSVDDGLGGGVPGDFLEGEGMAEEIFSQAFAAFGVMGRDGFFATAVDVEAGMFPGEEIGELAGADEFGVAEGVEEAVAEDEKAVGGEDVEVEDQVITKGVDGGDGTNTTGAEIEGGAENFLEGFGGGCEEEREEVAAVVEDAAQNARDGEDELAVRDFVAD